MEEEKWECKVLGRLPGFGGTILGMSFPLWRVSPFLWKQFSAQFVLPDVPGDSRALAWSRSPSSPWALPSLIPAPCWAVLISRSQNRGGIPRKFPPPHGPFSSHILGFFPPEYSQQSLDGSIQLWVLSLLQMHLIL